MIHDTEWCKFKMILNAIVLSKDPGLFRASKNLLGLGLELDDEVFLLESAPRWYSGFQEPTYTLYIKTPAKSIKKGRVISGELMAEITLNWEAKRVFSDYLMECCKDSNQAISNYYS